MMHMCAKVMSHNCGSGTSHCKAYSLLGNQLCCRPIQGLSGSKSTHNGWMRYCHFPCESAWQSSHDNSCVWRNSCLAQYHRSLYTNWTRLRPELRLTPNTVSCLDLSSYLSECCFYLSGQTAGPATPHPHTLNDDACAQPQPSDNQTSPLYEQAAQQKSPLCSLSLSFMP